MTVLWLSISMTYGLSLNHLCSVLSIHRWWEVGRFRIPSTTSRPALWRWLAWAPLGRGTWNADGRRLVAILVVEMMENHEESHINSIQLLTIHNHTLISKPKMNMLDSFNMDRYGQVGFVDFTWFYCWRRWCSQRLVVKDTENHDVAWLRCMIEVYDLWSLDRLSEFLAQHDHQNASVNLEETWSSTFSYIFYHFLIWLLYLLYFVMIYSVFTIIAYTFRQFRFLRHIFRGIFCIAEVFAVFWPCAVCYGILIPCFLFYLYTWQHIVLRHLVLGSLGHLRDVKETIKSLVYHQILVLSWFVCLSSWLSNWNYHFGNPPFLDRPHDCLFPLIRKRMKIQRFIPLEHESWSW